MYATTSTVTAVLLIWMTCYYCCCYCSAATQDRRHDGDHAREHSRTRNSTRQQRAKRLTAGTPPVTTAGQASSAVVTEAAVTEASADPEDNGNNGGGGGNTADVGLLRDYLVRRPTDVIRSLLQTGVNVVQTGMDAFEGASDAVYRTITPVRRSRTANSRSAGRRRRRRRRRRSTAARTDRPRLGLVRSVGRSVVDMLGTGISGAKQITDLGLLLGNIGTQKLRSELNGESGNREIFQILIKYVASRVGTRTSGNAEQLIDDVGTVSAFMAADDETTKAMSTVMERLTNDPDVCASMVRIAISMLQSSPSTSCLLDRLPLSASDIRMLFNVFVGSNGQLMMKTIAGMVSELTTGPETKEFLQAVLGMTSLFSGSADGKAASETPDKPKTSVYGSLKNFFTGEGAVDDKTTKTPTKPKKKRKSGGKKARQPPKAKLPKKTHIEVSKDDEDWFNDMDADNFGGGGGNTAAGSASVTKNSDAGVGDGGPLGSRTNISNGAKHGKKNSAKDDGGGNDFAP